MNRRLLMAKRFLGLAIAVAMALSVVAGAFAAPLRSGGEGAGWGAGWDGGAGGGLYAVGAAVSGGAIAADAYSPWAEEDIFLAQYVFNLGADDTYSNFLGGLTAIKFAPVLESFEAALKTGAGGGAAGGAGGAGRVTGVENQLTRGQVIAALHAAMDGSGGAGADADAAAVAAALAYFIDAGLIFGRAGGDYQLDEICTVEEMLSFAVRAYDHAIYEAGNYSTGFFWAVEGVANNVYLLGSIHLSDASMYPMSRPIEVAFARSANLVVEADIADVSAEDTAFIESIAYLDPAGDETIADYLSEETYALYVDVCEALGLPAEFYDYVKPWMASNFLTVYLMTSGDTDSMEESAALGIDLYFIQKSMAAGKNLLQLESIQFQMELLSSYSFELQDMMLKELLQSALPHDGGDGGDGDGGDSGDGDSGAAGLAAVFQAALEAIKAGDEETLIMLFGIDTEYDDPLLTEYNNKMFYERDVAMTEKIAGYLEDSEHKGDYFIVVGAAHLVSKKSVVAQLADLGYEVNRIK